MTQAFGPSWTAIDQYMSLTKDTESPKQYHLWSLISLVSAIAAPVTWLSHGRLGRVRLNMGVVLSGRASIRKSAAISLMRRFADGLGVYTGPTDVGGARHGIMTAMQMRIQNATGDEDESTSVPRDLEQLATADFENAFPIRAARNKPSHMFFAVNELGRLLTAQTRELLDFFSDGLDNEPIYYQTKLGSIRLSDPLITLLAATTPDTLQHIMPRDSNHHNILGRLVFIYARHAEKSVPIPPEWNSQQQFTAEQLRTRLLRIRNDATEAVTLTPAAVDEYVRLYGHTVPTIEFRLNPYAGRRAVHLLKLSALICLLRGDSPFQIAPTDLRLAHLILLLTESEMDGAFAGIDKTLEGKVTLYIRELIESQPEHRNGMDQGAVFSTLQRLGIPEDDITKTIERILRSGRLRIVNNRVQVETGLGAELSRIYFNSCLPVDEQTKLI